MKTPLIWKEIQANCLSAGFSSAQSAYLNLNRPSHKVVKVSGTSQIGCVDPKQLESKRLAAEIKKMELGRPSSLTMRGLPVFLDVLADVDVVASLARRREVRVAYKAFA